MVVFKAILSFLENFNVVLILMQFLLCIHLPRRKLFPVRLIAAVLFIFIFCKESSPIMPWHEYRMFSMVPFFSVRGVFNFAFIIIFACSVAVVLLCYKVPVSSAVVLCAAGYVAQNLSYHICYMLQHLCFNGTSDSLGYYIVALIVIIAVMAVLYFAFVKKFKVWQGQCSVGFVISFTILMFLVTSLLSYWVHKKDAYDYIFSIFILLCDSVLLYLFYNAYMKEQADRASKKAEEMLKQGEWQYQFYKENIDTINRKCHDLKHEIAVLRTISDQQERDSYISGLERAIMFYETKIKTGNEVIDILLSEKSVQCSKHGIEFSCIADGALLSFMKTADLSVFFGNSLDNAIEAELKEKPGDRHISVNVARRNDMAVVSIENSFSGALAINKAGNLPETTKSDKHSHGFGLYSISLIVKKYGGTMSIDVSDGKFRLVCLFNSINKTSLFTSKTEIV